MALVGLISDLFKNASNQKDISPIENILLNLRYRSLCKHSKSERRKIVMMGVPVSWISALLLAPITLILGYQKIIASLVLAIAPFAVFDIISGKQFVLLTLIIWIVLNYKDISDSLSRFAFDLVDFVSLGSLTEVALSIYKNAANEKKRDFINSKNQKLIAHLYASRQYYREFPENRWETYFSKISLDHMDDDEVIEWEVEHYWSHEGGLYDTQVPPILDDKAYWEYESFWSNLTPTILKKAIDELEDIEEVRSTYDNDATILTLSLIYGADFSKVKFILTSGANPNAHYKHWLNGKFSVLSAAILHSTTQIVQLLLDKGAVVNSKSEGSSGLNILQLAAIYAQNIEGYLIIKERCEELDTFVDANGYSLLHLATQSPRNQSHILRELVASGLDVNDQTNNAKDSPLMCYFWGNKLFRMGGGGEPRDIENLKTLMKLGADISLSNENGLDVESWLSTRYFEEEERAQIESVLNIKFNNETD